jgi:hypothetical protein
MTNHDEQNPPKDQPVVEVTEPPKQSIDSNADSEESNRNEPEKGFDFLKDLKDLFEKKPGDSTQSSFYIYNDSRSGGSYFED